MNILVPYQWLLEHLDTDVSPEEMQKNLALCGPSVERIYEVEGEPVFDIEVTTNRVDAASIRGIAREAAAILPEFGQAASLKPLELPTVNNQQKLDINIQNDPSLCHRILAIKLEHVQLGNSPDWLQKRLIQVGQRPLNNAIDITNYVMWEVGHPIHAFDYDRLMEKKIVVREARPGEKVTTLDDKTHTLKGGEVIFDDGTGTIIDIPGIMGTANTVVTNETKSVLLFLESTDARKIRLASMGLGIRTQAAILNEKGVDPELGLDALLRATKLYQEVCQASIASQIVDIYPKKLVPEKISLKSKQISAYLGVDVESDRVQRILQNLGCHVKITSEGFDIEPPSWRIKDLQIPQDYIEEIARIYGYHNLPSVIMDTTIPDNPPKEDFRWEQKTKRWLAGWGATEIYTYSMVSKKVAAESNYPIDSHLAIKNPLSDDWVYMRRSLVPSLLEVLKENPSKTTTIFELQNVYHPQKGNLPTEELRLALVSNQGFDHLKGMLDALMEKLYVENYAVVPTKNQNGQVMSGDNILGTITHNSVELIVEVLQKVSASHPRYIPVISAPAIIEDYTLTLPENTHIGPVIQTIKAQSELIEAVELKDRYQQNYTFTVIYRHQDRSLSDEELIPIRKSLVATLNKKHQATLVGQL